MNHRGPIPLRELHSTDETIVWRDTGGSWACLQLVYQWLNQPVTCCDTCHLHLEKHNQKKWAIRNVKNEQNHSEEKVGKRKCKTWMKKKHSAQIIVLKNRMNSTAMMRTWIERRTPGKARDRNNEKRKEPYDVPTTRERQRRRPKRSIQRKKVAPTRAAKKRTFKKNTSEAKGLKQDWKSNQNRRRSKT